MRLAFNVSAGTHADALCPRGRGATAQKAQLSTLVGSKLKGRVATTWSVNIIIRAFLYLANTYNDYFTRTGQNLYISKKASVPTPELYVIYTGDKREVPECISFKEEFIQNKDCAIDVKIKVLNSKYDTSIIGQYIMFCKVYDEQRRIYGRTKKAIEETIRICLDKDILTEYLKEHEKEVKTIMLALFDEKYLSRAYEATLREELTEEITAKVERETAQRVERETAQREARQIASNLLKIGDLSTDKIAESTGLSVDEVNKLKNKID